jgi:rhamnose utilization protein RhaD (predicted bifunctional aldolase and dehydrogenase)
MKSAWVGRDARAAVDRYGKAGIAADLALRIYSTQLLGRNAKLVLQGGGNTSLKTAMRDLTGEDVAVLRVKGSGADMGTIEPAGFPAVRLEPLRKLRARVKLSDADMARAQRAYLIDPQAPSPSVEMLLHAFVPATYVDHTHATAVLSLIDQPNAAELCAEVFSGRLGFVPYLMPGFGLAKKAAVVFEQNPQVEGLILDKHGIFTFGGDARECYERMIEMVTLAEQRLGKSRKAVFAAAKLPRALASAANVAPILRGACTLRDAFGEGAHKRPILEFRTGDAILNYVNGKQAAAYACAGVITPDHVIRTKPWPLIVPAPEAGRLDDFNNAARQAARKFIDDYKSYFERHKARAGGAAMHDPMPPTLRKPRSKASPAPKRSDASPRFPKPTCSIANIGRSNWPSSPRAKLCRSRARSRSSPAPAAPSAQLLPTFSRRPARKWRCSISMPARRRKEPEQSAARPSRFPAM